MADFLILPADFAATTVEVVCASQSAKTRQCGAASINIRKSALPDFVARMESEGLRCELSA
jgi:hypothetical protein